MVDLAWVFTGPNVGGANEGFEVSQRELAEQARFGFGT
jgi:hypothetical protein